MLKLNIGFNREVGEANYSSRGANVNLEIEVESGLVREPDKLQAKIDYLFGLAKSSVDAQLNGKGRSQPTESSSAQNHNGNGTPGHSNGQTGGNDSHAAAGSNGNGNGSHRASEK